jgi:hypothetical protein
LVTIRPPLPITTRCHAQTPPVYTLCFTAQASDSFPVSLIFLHGNTFHVLFIWTGR